MNFLICSLICIVKNTMIELKTKKSHISYSFDIKKELMTINNMLTIRMKSMGEDLKKMEDFMSSNEFIDKKSLYHITSKEKNSINVENSCYNCLKYFKRKYKNLNDIYVTLSSINNSVILGRNKKNFDIIKVIIRHIIQFKNPSEPGYGDLGYYLKGNNVEEFTLEEECNDFIVKSVDSEENARSLLFSYILMMELQIIFNDKMSLKEINGRIEDICNLVFFLVKTFNMFLRQIKDLQERCCNIVKIFKKSINGQIKLSAEKIKELMKNLNVTKILNYNKDILETAYAFLICLKRCEVFKESFFELFFKSYNGLRMGEIEKTVNFLSSLHEGAAPFRTVNPETEYVISYVMTKNPE